MAKERKHLTPPKWEKENSGNSEHPHKEVRIVGEKKIGQEPAAPDDQENKTKAK